MVSQVSFIRHVFTTLTYARTRSKDMAWQSVSKDFNRYCQKQRRLHNTQCQYLRCIETHKDGYPHIHVLLQYPSAIIRVENNRYFDRRLYTLWKKQWPHGLSDHQPPRHLNTSAIKYILKYISKNTTCKTVWKKVLKNVNSATQLQQNGTPTKATPDSISSATPVLNTTTKSLIKKNGVKLLTWSRGFDFSVFAPTQRSVLATDVHTLT